MKALILLLLPMLLCSACTALPAEERAFAVALCVERTESWRVYGRIPTYQSGGGYITVSGQGETLAAALDDMDAASPMRINLSQLRLLVAEEELARSGELSALLTALADRPDMRMECAVALTAAPVQTVVEALTPAAGTRLSKALDLLLEARVEQGAILPARLSQVLRMGERQSPVLIALALDGEEITLSGGVTAEGLHLDWAEIALLSLLLGHAKSLHLTLGATSAEVREVSANVRLSEDLATARVTLTLTAPSAADASADLEQALADALLALLTRLANGGSDVLGLGRQTVTHVPDMPAWHALNWPERYRAVRWEVAVSVRGPA